MRSRTYPARHSGTPSSAIAILPADPTKGENREYFVRVRVRWSEKGDNQFIEISTLMCNTFPKIQAPAAAGGS